MITVEDIPDFDMIGLTWGTSRRVVNLMGVVNPINLDQESRLKPWPDTNHAQRECPDNLKKSVYDSS